MIVLASDFVTVNNNLNPNNAVRSEDDVSDGENCESTHATIATTQPRHPFDHVLGRLERNELEKMGEKEVMNEIITFWQSCRLEVSIGLGSIGAPPLGQTALRLPYKSTFNYFRAISSEHSPCLQEPTGFFDVILQLSAAHIDLLQTMDHVSTVFRVGTGVRLGLGPYAAAAACSNYATINSGYSGLVSRAEKAWISRRLRKKDKFQSNCSQRFHPNLTLQRSRRILHQAIVDQVTSLQGLLKFVDRKPEGESEHDEWNEFIEDLQHSRRPTSPHGCNTPVLTLSQLSSWLSRIGCLLSYILSGCLSPGGLVHLFEDSCTGIMRLSTQMANERVAFLTSAFPLTVRDQKEQSKHDTNGCESTKATLGWARNSEGNEPTHSRPHHSERQAKKIIERLHSIMDTARVTLWAFQNSFSNGSNAIFHCDYCDDYDCPHNNQKSLPEVSVENEIESANIWWSEFKELVSQALASVTEFEDHFLVKSNGDSGKDDSRVAEQNPEPSNEVATDLCSELVSNIPSNVSSSDFAGGDNEPDEQRAEKTLVFSGRGTHNKNGKIRNNPSKCNNVVPPPPAFSAMDQMILLRDLEKMLKTMRLAEEHEVVADDHDDNTDMNQDECFQSIGDSKSVNVAELSKQKDIVSSQPFFLGVSGDLLSELSSAVMENLPNVEQINIDSNDA